MAPRILLADDNDNLRKAAGRLLQDAGYQVVSSQNGADAVCMMAAKPAPDLILLDLMMPGLDGHEVLKQLGPTAPPVIVITGSHMEPGDFETGHVKRVLVKPFDAEKLLRTVAEVLSLCGLADTKLETNVPPVPMTEEERAKAEERHKRNNGNHSYA